MWSWRLPVTDAAHSASSIYALVTVPSPTVLFNHRYRASLPLPILSASSSFQALASFPKGDREKPFMDDTGDGDLQASERPSPQDDDDADGIEIEIEKVSKNRRRIRSRVAVDASLQTLWGILTDYERLADFIPGLAVSQVLDRGDNFARLFQIGQQNLAFGLKFRAKGIVDCYEKDFEILPYGQRRDIEFKMIEGDFQLFEGKWSIEQSTTMKRQQSGSQVRQEFQTTLSYAVDVEPKMWLPVQLVEGRLCREIKMNLSCIRAAARTESGNISSG